MERLGFSTQHTGRIRSFLRRTDPIMQIGKKRRVGSYAPHPHKHLYGSRWWRENRMKVIAANPLCETCGRLAEEVDHIKPHRGDKALFEDASNLQALCKACHKAKTRLDRWVS